MRFVCRVLSACVFVVAFGNAVSQSKDPCSDVDSQRAWDSGRDPVYAEAMDLARTLSNSGFKVECVRSSKQADLFEGQKGAAWYKAKEGLFEVLFLPKSKSFKDLEIMDEPRPGGRHRYSFRGTPHSATTMDGAKTMAFIRHENLMFEVLDNEELAKHLAQLFPED